ncbi:MAG: endonuclease domain-containing protein [Alphaproteobacteria bacterium]|nr:endonuclease domain-containing protein [Alphaproteobacteria bacterium]
MSQRSIQKAKRLRQKSTDAENIIWHHVRNRQMGCKFRRQAPVGRYIVDFMCLELKLVIEIDGGQHCESVHDDARTEFLESLGFRVVRFWNNDVVNNIEGVLSTLTLTLSQGERELETNNDN